ncbi:hypothetical protein [Xanthomonas hortorum]|uniref:hypothetical protein n=1 Tax=Xanthomonas hortorum TaxID=56454 RepID=UPI00293555DF|nr:hypothetical protein [Xanthomonas hortorum]MDV2452724.1 hypothetical protein [Xanthomonas hortorum NBC5720]
MDFRSSDDFNLHESYISTGWNCLHISCSASIASTANITSPTPLTENSAIVLRVPNNPFWKDLGKTHENVLAEDLSKTYQRTRQPTLQFREYNILRNKRSELRMVTNGSPMDFGKEESAGTESTEYACLTLPVHPALRIEDVDVFTTISRRMMPHEKLHIHCNSGLRHAGILITMHDMLKNATTVSFADIINRQLAFNKIHSLAFDQANHCEEGLGLFNSQLDFIALFYEYAKSDLGAQPLPWSEWLGYRSA